MSTTINKFATGTSPWVVAGWMALGVIGAVAIALLVPPEVLAGVSGNSGGGDSTEAAKNFNRKGKSTLEEFGVPIFGACAMAGLATAAFSKKVGMGALVVLVSAFGLAISIDPKATLGGIGDGIADLFKS